MSKQANGPHRMGKSCNKTPESTLWDDSQGLHGEIESYSHGWHTLLLTPNSKRKHTDCGMEALFFVLVFRPKSRFKLLMADLASLEAELIGKFSSISKTLNTSELNMRVYRYRTARYAVPDWWALSKKAKEEFQRSLNRLPLSSHWAEQVKIPLQPKPTPTFGTGSASSRARHPCGGLDLKHRLFCVKTRKKWINKKKSTVLSLFFYFFLQLSSFLIKTICFYKKNYIIFLICVKAKRK